MKGPILVLGASPNPEKWANKAVIALKRNGFDVIGVHPDLDLACGFDFFCDLQSVVEAEIEIDGISLYLSPQRLAGEIENIMALEPRYVIFNPGTFSEEIACRFKEQEIEVIEACTLVMLESGSFDRLYPCPE